MPEFDFPAGIRKLAEAETQPVLDSPYPGDIVVNLENGRIVPFAALRVECVVGEHHDGYGEAWHGHYPDVHRGDTCPGWVPEPDVEKACHRVAKVVEKVDHGLDIAAWWYDPDAEQWYWNNRSGYNIKASCYEEAIICSGLEVLAWLEAQRI